jgi:hypothetical protein
LRVKCLSFVGDHPGLRQEELPYHKPLPKKDLYLAAGEGIGWVPLFPVLVARNCPNCKTRETYFLDKWDREKGIASLKSFERGHEEKANDVVENMESWLPPKKPRTTSPTPTASTK